MRRFIYYLRQKPEHVKWYILHAASLVIGVILITLWVWSFNKKVININQSASVIDANKPFSVLKDSIKGGYSVLLQGNNSVESNPETEIQNIESEINSEESIIVY